MATPSDNLEPTRPAADVLPVNGRVLVVRLSALGDVLFALETVAALKADRPDLRIEFLVEDRFVDLLQDHPQLDAVHVYPRRDKLRILPALWRLRRRRFDAILDLHGILKSSVQVRLLRAARKIGYAPPGAREGSHRAYDTAVDLPTPLPHRADMGHHLLAALGLPGTPHRAQIATLPPADDLLAGLPQPIVLMHPGTSAFARFKRWPTDRYAELARRLEQRGLGTAVSFGPGEQEIADAVVAQAPQTRLIDGASLGLRGLAGVMQQVAVVVGGDTGPLHIAAAVGTPCVAIFGPKDPDRYQPRAHNGQTHEVLFHDVPCRPCRRRQCASPQCVLGVTVDAVEQATLRQCDQLPAPQ